jgi:pilus assembly protein CpaC
VIKVAVLSTIRRCALALMLGCALGAAPAHANLTREPGKHAGEFIVPVNQSQILRLDVPFTDVMVGNAAIADVLPMTDQTIYVLGKEVGTTSVTFYAKDKKLVAIANLTVAPDIEGLKARLFELMPDEKIQVRPVNGALVLSGGVSGAGRMTQILAVAERYAPGKITNLLSVKGSQQVMLAVRFAEVSRSVVKDLDLSTRAFGNNFSLTTGSRIPSVGALAAPIAGFASGALIGTVGNTALSVLFDALEKKGLVKTLAEPNLIALSGDTASFLAGGEFPVPVAQAQSGGGTTITVEFKQFGVSLSFTPTVLDEGLINIVVAPEVSRIDKTRSVSIVPGLDPIPGLTTRRAKTTVELRDGQSFAIAGLIQNDFQDTVSQFPGLGDVPVLGALMRSSDFERGETELVIIVTPHLVKPAPAASMALPSDRFVPPSDMDLFLFGRTESKASGAAGQPAPRALGLPGAGGIDGPYGHIIK